MALFDHASIVQPPRSWEAIEIALPEAGIVAFQHGFDVWKTVTAASGLEPTIDVHGANPT
jgi:4-carboxymuconolactone decarboxylase